MATTNSALIHLVFSCTTYHKHIAGTPIMYVGDSEPVLNTMINNKTEHKI